MTFEKQGPHNTEAALKLAIEAAREEGIHKIVVASSTGLFQSSTTGTDSSSQASRSLMWAMPGAYSASMSRRCPTRCVRTWRPWV